LEGCCVVPEPVVLGGPEDGLVEVVEVVVLELELVVEVVLVAVVGVVVVDELLDDEVLVAGGGHDSATFTTSGGRDSEDTGAPGASW
jgi:hypothetical protein